MAVRVNTLNFDGLPQAHAFSTEPSARSVDESFASPKPVAKARVTGFELQRLEYVDANHTRLKMDMRVLWRGTYPATVRFIGKIRHREGIWVGIELDDMLGRNDGSIDGTQYFKCDSQRGMFVRPQACSGFPSEPTPWGGFFSRMFNAVWPSNTLRCLTPDTSRFHPNDMKRVWIFTMWRNVRKVILGHHGNVWFILVSGAQPVSMKHNRFLHLSTQSYVHDFTLNTQHEGQVSGTLRITWSQEVMKWVYRLTVNNTEVPYSWTRRDGYLGLGAYPEVVCRAVFRFRVKGDHHQVEIGEYGNSFALVHNGALIRSLEHKPRDDLMSGLPTTTSVTEAAHGYSMNFDISVKPYGIVTHCIVKIHWAHTTNTWQYLVSASNSWVRPCWVCDQQLSHNESLEVTDSTVQFTFKSYTEDGTEKINVLEVLDSEGLWRIKFNGEDWREVESSFRYDLYIIQLQLVLPSEGYIEVPASVHCKLERGDWSFSLTVNGVGIRQCWSWLDEQEMPVVTPLPPALAGAAGTGFDELPPKAAAAPSSNQPNKGGKSGETFRRTVRLPTNGTSREDAETYKESWLVVDSPTHVSVQAAPRSARGSPDLPFVMQPLQHDVMLYENPADYGITEGVLDEDTAMALAAISNAGNPTFGAPGGASQMLASPRRNEQAVEVEEEDEASGDPPEDGHPPPRNAGMQPAKVVHDDLEETQPVHQEILDPASEFVKRAMKSHARIAHMFG